MKDVIERLESWVRWHLWIGFERLYLFFDDPHEVDSMALARACGGDAVRVIKRDEELRRHWERQPSWAGHYNTFAKEVQVRQVLNVQVAMELARDEGITWLLNIDSDELFHPDVQHATTTIDGGAAAASGAAAAAESVRGVVPALFSSLAAAGVEVFVFVNHEVVPESVAPVDLSRSNTAKARGDPFRDLSLFKLANCSAFVAQTAETAGLIDSWRRRQSSKNYFLYYEHGKAAVRCDTDGSYVPPTVHLFLPRKRNSQEWDSDRLKARGFTNDDRNLGLFSYRPSQRATILHYAIWDAHALWAKYSLHGDFPDAIVGATTKGGMEWGDMFHTHCRDYLRTRRADADGGRSAMHELFRTAAALEDAAVAQRQLAAGVLARVTVVQVVLGQAALQATPQTGSQPPALMGPALRGTASDDDKEEEDDEGLLLEENGGEAEMLAAEEEDDDDDELCLEVNLAAASSADDDEDDELLLEENEDDDETDEELLLEGNDIQ